ncbi:MAG: hypothetical protein ACXVP0_13870 [Bacteroidia bacterium]
MRISKTIKTYLQAAVQLLLACVIIVNLGAADIHELTGHLQVHEQACGGENEQDACHRYVYHHEQSQACNGSHEHITASVKECFSCTYFKERRHDAFFHREQSQQYCCATSVSYADKTLSIPFSNPQYACLRGPPALS